MAETHTPTQGSPTQGRWAGRNMTKDQLRQEIWAALETRNFAIGPAFSRIPNFVGADKAAARLAELAIWQTAKVVKSNPDPPQIPVRLRALQDGKILYMPVPELTADFPFLEMDPVRLQQQGIPFETVATAEGAMQYGKRVDWREMQPYDLCVVGCVAVTRNGGRTGKGAGFADLELGIMRLVGLVTPATPVVTTVHSTQVVDNERVVMVNHDTPLDWVITPDEAIKTQTHYPDPQGIDWEAVQPDQYENIPFLRALRAQLTGG